MLQDRAIPGATRLHVLAAILSVLMASPSAFEIIVVPPNPQVGDTVLLDVTGINETLRYSEWYKGKGILAENQIIRYNNGVGSTNKGDKFFEEAHIQSNGSLVIRNVTKEMAGSYTVVVQGLTKPFQESITLTVKDPPKPTPESKSGLSSGAIAGICIAILVVVAAIVGGIYLYKSKDSGPL